MDKDRIAKESNKDLVGLFVAHVGADYRTDYSPHLWPNFSEDTVKLWEEIEARMTGRTTLGFDRDRCENKLREAIQRQTDLLKGGPDSATSFHYGIRSGLNLAFRIVEDSITAGGDHDA